jgi:hypothetical protein
LPDRACCSEPAQNPAPPLPLEPPPPEGLDVVGVVLLGCPPLVLPPLEPQAAVAMPNPTTSTIGAIRRAMLRRVVDPRVIFPLLNHAARE